MQASEDEKSQPVCARCSILLQIRKVKDKLWSMSLRIRAALILLYCVWSPALPPFLNRPQHCTGIERWTYGFRWSRTGAAAKPGQKDRVQIQSYETTGYCVRRGQPPRPIIEPGSREISPKLVILPPAIALSEVPQETHPFLGS